jgi:hypothetical protein
VQPFGSSQHFMEPEDTTTVNNFMDCCFVAPYYKCSYTLEHMYILPQNNHHKSSIVGMAGNNAETHLQEGPYSFPCGSCNLLGPLKLMPM